MNGDKTFLIILGAIFSFMVLVGIGATVLSLVTETSEAVSLSVVRLIASMFSSVIGLVLGYMVGKRNGRNGH